jgi:hypothetical protein
MRIFTLSSAGKFFKNKAIMLARLAYESIAGAYGCAILGPPPEVKRPTREAKHGSKWGLASVVYVFRTSMLI